MYVLLSNCKAPPIVCSNLNYCSMHVMTRVLRGRRNVRKQDRPIKPCILFAWWAGDDDNPGLAQGRIWEGNPGPDAAQMPKYNQRAIDGKKNNAVREYDHVIITQLRRDCLFT